MNFKNIFKSHNIIKIFAAITIIWISDINRVVANSIWLTKDKVYDSNENASNNISFKNLNNIHLNIPFDANSLSQEYSSDILKHRKYGINFTIIGKPENDFTIIKYDTNKSGFKIGIKTSPNQSVSLYTIVFSNYYEDGILFGNNYRLPPYTSSTSNLIDLTNEKTNISVNIGNDLIQIFINGKFISNIPHTQNNIWDDGKLIVGDFNNTITNSDLLYISDLRIYTSHIPRKLNKYYTSKDIYGLIDSDDDGLFDEYEITKNTDPNSIDSDEDGIIDGDEVNLYNTNPTKKDTDDDGFWDLTELNFNSSAKRKSSIPNFELKHTFFENALHITFPSSNKLKYQLLKSQNFQDWKSHGPFIKGNGKKINISNISALKNEFFKLQIVE
jgi:hypothetical protein